MDTSGATTDSPAAAPGTGGAGDAGAAATVELMSFAITFGGDLAATDSSTQAAIRDQIVVDLVARSETRMVAITADSVRRVTLSSGSIVAMVVFEVDVDRDYALSLRQDVEDNAMTITVNGTDYTSTAVSSVTTVPRGDAPALGSTGVTEDKADECKDPDTSRFIRKPHL